MNNKNLILGCIIFLAMNISAASHANTDENDAILHMRKKKQSYSTKMNIHKHSQSTLNNKLLKAAAIGCIGDVDKLIYLGADVNFVYKKNGNTPLIVASKNGHVEVVRSLINANAKVNYRFSHAKCTKDYRLANDHKSALHKASENGHLETVYLLLVAGAKPDILWWKPTILKDMYYTPADLALERGHKEIYKILTNISENKKTFPKISFPNILPLLNEMLFRVKSNIVCNFIPAKIGYKSDKEIYGEPGKDADNTFSSANLFI